MAGYLGAIPVPQATQHRESFTASSGQTTFNTAGYTVGFLDVYLNGSHLSPADFTATNGSDVVLASGASADDVCDIISYTAFEVNSQTFTGTTTLDGAVVINESSADVDFRVESNGNANMLFVDGGNDRVGIGTSSPSGVLDIRNGTTQQVIIGNSGSYTGSEYGELLFKESSTELARVKWNPSGNTFQLINKIAGPITFATNNTERMRITSAGDLFINATASKSTIARAFIQYSSASQYGLELHATSASVPATQIAFYQNNNLTGSVQSTATATAYNTSSDYRLKTDAQPMTGASDRVLALNPVNFEWIASGDRVDGFLAHEAQSVVPECVTGTKDAMRDEEYEVTPAVLDADGNVTAPAVMGTRSVPDMQGIDQSKMVPLLVAALQEALARITALENA